MLQKIENSFAEIDDFPNRNYLLAISGGVDSMVLIHIFNKLGLQFSIAHCNFQLRGEQSEMDEELVNRVAKELNVGFYSKKFDIESFKKKNKASTQMAARELRYSWFRELCAERNLDLIVVGHHLNDKVETVLLNLTRGTGIDGITGIKALSDSVFRPMLSVSKEEIHNYAKTNEIEFREDLSNEDLDYKRNKIRNQVVPILTELNGSFLSTMEENMKHFRSVNLFYKKAMDEKLQEIISKFESDLSLEIDSSKLMKSDFPEIMLYEILKNYGYNFDQVTQITSAINSEKGTGKFFYSKGFELLIDRNKLLMSHSVDNEHISCIISKGDKKITYPVNLSLKEMLANNFELVKSSEQAFFDLEKIVFPLKIRKWKEGDYFQPFGMTGKKKVSDFLIDNKISRIEKESTYVLLSNDKIIWLIGHRTDDNYKISSQTKRILNITLV